MRLKKRLAELTAKIEAIEARKDDKAKRGRDSRPALVRKELEQMLDYKRQHLRDLESGKGPKGGQGLKQLEDDVRSVKEQVEQLERHWKSREEVLEGLRAEIAAEKR